MKVIEITKKTESKTDQIQFIISILCVVSEIKLSKTDISVLSYFVVYGLKQSTEDLIIKSKIVKDMPQLRNVKTKLLRKGFMRRTNGLYKSYELNLNKGFNNEDQLNLLIKTDNG